MKQTLCAALAVFRYKSKYKTIGVLPIRIVKSIVLSVGPSSESDMLLSDKGRYTLKTLLCGISTVHQHFSTWICIILYCYAVHYVYFLTKEPHFVEVVLISSLNFVFKLRTIASQ